MTDPQPIIDDLTKRLHGFVDAVPGDHTIDRTAHIYDEQQVCHIAQQGDWPVRWSYAVRWWLHEGDARPAGRELVESYTEQGWEVRYDPPSDGADEYVLQKNGYSISLQAAPDHGILTVRSGSPCVNADGTILITHAT